MPSISASAPAKCILFGEHAVVYGYPAIAIPVHTLRAKAVIAPEIRGGPGRIMISAPEVNFQKLYSAQNIHDAYSFSLRTVFDYLKIQNPPPFELKITSAIPIAAGLGSGASIAVAITRAVSAFVGKPLSQKEICRIAFEIEKVHHGTPSGIDNTVIAYEEPIYFIKNKPFTRLDVDQSMEFLVADSNIRSKTIDAVSKVRNLKECNEEKVKNIFDDIHWIVKSARKLIREGDLEQLGMLLTLNHEHLAKLGVSHPKLDLLVSTAIKSGAYGAKLTGAGLGGHVLALVNTRTSENVLTALKQAGAGKVIKTALSPIRSGSRC